MNNSFSSDQLLFEQKIHAHLYNYYWKKLGLFDWQKRIDARAKRDVSRSKIILKAIEKVANTQFCNSKMLDIGSGWGGFVVAANEIGMEAWGCDVDEQVIEIAKLRSKIHNVHSNYCLAKAEKLPFPDNFFDYVQCVTVLEHVEDVNKTIGEFIRVLKKGGVGFIQAPNYHQPLENHYKILFPPMLPKTLAKIYLLLLARPYKYIDSINYIDYESVNLQLLKNNVEVTDIRTRLKQERQKLSSTAKPFFETFDSHQKLVMSYNSIVSRIMSRLKAPVIRFVEDQLHIYEINFLIRK